MGLVGDGRFDIRDGPRSICTVHHTPCLNAPSLKRPTNREHKGRGDRISVGIAREDEVDGGHEHLVGAVPGEKVAEHIHDPASASLWIRTISKTNTPELKKLFRDGDGSTAVRKVGIDFVGGLK